MAVLNNNTDTTAGQVITRALKSILVEATDSTLEADEYADALSAMNSFMASLEADGVLLGYQPVCNIADVVSIPDGAIRGLVANLAIELAPQFGGRVSGALVQQAATSLNVMYKMGVQVGISLPPNTLPFGSGNYNTRSLMFYRASPFCGVTTAANRIATVLSTASVAVKAAAYWTVGEFHGLRPDISGRITNMGEQITVNFAGEFALKSQTATAGGTVVIAQNGAVVLYTTDSLTTSPLTLLVTGTLTLNPGDYLDVLVCDTVGANQITLVDAVVQVT